MTKEIEPYSLRDMNAFKTDEVGEEEVIRVKDFELPNMEYCCYCVVDSLLLRVSGISALVFRKY